MTKTLLALTPLLANEMETLERDFEIIRLWKSADPEQTIKDHSKEIVGIISGFNTPVTARLMQACPNLEIVSQFAVGTNNIDLAAAKENGIKVTNTPDVLTDETADTAMSLLLAVSKRICEADMYVRFGRWHTGPFGLGTSLNGKTAGIVGLGRIGQAIAKRLEAFNIRVIYTGRSEKPELSYSYYDDLKEMAEDCDFLILACSGGPDTDNLITYDVLEALGKKGFVINIARGSVLNEDDLLAALSNKAIAGAGLDVFANEPHVPEALYKMDNVVLLPHIGSATTETRTIMGRLVVDNLQNHFQEKSLKTPVIS